MLRMLEVPDLRRHDSRVARIREIQKLFKLMTADIDQNSAVLRLLQKPRGAFAQIRAVRSKSQRLHYFPNRPRFAEFARVLGRRALQPFAIKDGVELFR